MTSIKSSKSKKQLKSLLRKGEASKTDSKLHELAGLLRTYEQTVGSIGKLEEKKEKTGRKVLTIFIEGNLAERYGEVKKTGPLISSTFIPNVGGRPFPINRTHVAKIVDDKAFRAYIRSKKLNYSDFFNPTTAPLTEGARAHQKKEIDILNDMISRGIIELATRDQIHVPGKKKEVKIGR